MRPALTSFTCYAPPMRSLQQQVEDGQRAYTPLTLHAYDPFVHGVVNSLVWGCPTARLVDWHRRQVGRRHCEVGVGTGYLLERSQGPIEELTLVDLNDHCLGATASRLAHLAPRCIRHSVLAPLEGTGHFDSIGLGYLLHCVPGVLGADKAVAFDHLGRLLARDGVLFGSTVLGHADAPSLRARAMMALYNRLGIFHNEGDTLQGLIHALAERFSEHEVHRVGAVALFAAGGYRG